MNCLYDMGRGCSDVDAFQMSLRKIGRLIMLGFDGLRESPSGLTSDRGRMEACFFYPPKLDKSRLEALRWCVASRMFEG